MFDHSFIVVCVIILMLLLVIICYDLFKKKMFLLNMKKFSIAPYLPLIGSLYLMKELDLMLSFRKAKRIVRNDSFIWFHIYVPIYVTYNAHDFEIIVSNVLERGLVYELIGDNVIPNSLLTAKVSLWKINRKIISKSFRPHRLYNIMLTMNEQVKELVNICSRTEGGLSIVEKHSRFFFEAFSWNFTWGHTEVKDDSFDLCDALRTYYWNIFRGIRNPYKRLTMLWLYPNMLYKLSKMKKKLDKLNSTFNIYVKNNIDILRKNKQEGNMDPNIIQALDRYNIPDETILSEIKVLYGGATDTTALTLTMTLIALGIYPDIQEKVLNEVMEFVGSERFITHTDLNQLKYTEMVIKETLRLFPPAPCIMRKTSRPIDLENKTIPKDMEIVLWIGEIHRNELYWKNPLEFNPDRFLPGETAKRHPFAFVPFSGGPRNCIGYKYAMIFLVIAVSQYVRKYTIRCSYKSIHDIKVKSFVTTQLIDKNVMCSFIPRNINGPS